MDEIRGPHRLINFRLLYLLVQLVGATLIILMTGWISVHLGGMGWRSTPGLQFNWHPFLMTVGMIFLYGNSILLYRGFRYSRKRNLKLSHATIFGTIMILTIIGLVAVFDSHNLANPPIPNLYSLHSWMGLATVILFGLQWIGGFVSFLYPQIKGPLKEAVMPFHIYFGLIGFVMAVATALLGVSEKAFFHMKNYSDLPNEGVLVNFIGVFMIIFASLVVYMVTNSDYRRQPLPEDAILLSSSASDD